MLDAIRRILISVCRWSRDLVRLVVARIQEFGRPLQVVAFVGAICIGIGLPLAFHSCMMLPFFVPLDPAHEREVAYGIFMFSGFLSVMFPTGFALSLLRRPHKGSFWAAVVCMGLTIGSVLGVGLLEPAFWRGA